MNTCMHCGVGITAENYNMKKRPRKVFIWAPLLSFTANRW